MTLVADAPVVTPPVTQLEEMKNIKPVRKKRAPRHDFKDGNGKVPAHRHDNGKGWIADTARVEDNVYVGAGCEVFQYARVVGACRLQGGARVYGHAAVSGNVIMRKASTVSGCAAVCDTTELHENANISGSARVCGSSRIYGRASIRDHAYILGSCMSGSAEISGNTTVIRSSLTGEITMAGNATAVNASLTGRISLRDFCQILNSTINFRTSGDQAFVAYGYAVIADNSNISMPITVKDHAILVRVQSNGYDWHGQPALTFANSIVATNRRFNSYNDVVLFLQQFENRGNNMYTPAPAPVPVRGPVNVQPSLRRVMRLETAEA
jgi:acyl-[acyl carrier protein]--UDP-N-acetylglucosamine O-acyltransferase